MTGGMFPFPCLVADVGGTNIRLASLESPDAPLSPVAQSCTADVLDFGATLSGMVRAAGFPPFRSLLVAAAGPVCDRRVTLSNAMTARGPLSIDGPLLRAELGLEQGFMINDFAALSYVAPFLRADDLLPLGAPRPGLHGAPQAVIGPGTGLGVGVVLLAEGRILALASEGGHMGLGAQSPEDFALWPYLSEGRVLADDILSGRGLVRLYQALRSMKGLPAVATTPESVGMAALAGDDGVAVEAVERFFALLGRVAGDLALIFGARGGVFIGGGIAPRFTAMLQSGPFRRHFEDKGSYAPYLGKIPVWLITAMHPTLRGLAELARAPERFVIDRTELWR